MSTADSTSAHPAAHPAVHASGHDAPHGPDHVHVYETGISEGNKRVPPWLLAVVVALFSFFIYYVATQWGAQPSSARIK